ncbi:hypothetical protein Pcinc_012861 [Petrolisthes cinctipes]|uniref:Uncharacterized protein n=1 Tax=Petrolisthes cinctipes TaxID=88211 RepID=A0AAE1KRN9_PETCI|nr:hypothetical protein Pcinc_014109 [Petrolisthes cinctipes]KAK3882783.1 hypothetical protein Pcinc_012861 [Petrolisthes cinctipes]
MPSNCTGFSAFDLLYSRSVRGPLTSGRIESSGRPDQPAVELREKLSECALLTSQEADVSITSCRETSTGVLVQELQCPDVGQEFRCL